MAASCAGSNFTMVKALGPGLGICGLEVALQTDGGGPEMGHLSARFGEESEVRAQVRLPRPPPKAEERELIGQGKMTLPSSGEACPGACVRSALATLSPFCLCSNLPGSRPAGAARPLPHLQLRASESSAPFSGPGSSSLPPRALLSAPWPAPRDARTQACAERPTRPLHIRATGNQNPLHPPERE